MSTVQVDQTNIKKVPILVSLLVGAFVGMFSEMSLNVALSGLMKELSVSATTIQWLTTAYMLVISILVPISALLLRRFTTRQLFLTAQLLFTLGTLVGALSPNFTTLLIARLIQATGTGLLIPLIFNTILLITPPEKRGSMMGMIGLVIMFAPAIAPTIAGSIIQYMDWHWLFLGLLPILAFDIVFGYLYIKNVSEVQAIKIDIVSILLSTMGFGGLVYGFSSTGEGGGSSSMVWLAIGVIGLIVFIWRQLTMKDPMMNLRTFKYPMYSLGVVLVMITMLIIFAFLILTPLYLQNGLGLSASLTGLILLPGGILNGFLSPVTGRLFDKFGPTWMVRGGIVIVAMTLWFFSQLTSASSFMNIMILHSSLMVGISMVIMPAQTNALNQLPRELYPHGTAILNTIQQLSGAVGTALCVAIMSIGQRQYMENLAPTGAAVDAAQALIVGVQKGFLFVFILAIIGFFFALFIKRAQQEHVRH